MEPEEVLGVEDGCNHQMMKYKRLKRQGTIPTPQHKSELTIFIRNTNKHPKIGSDIINCKPLKSTNLGVVGQAFMAP